MVRKLATEKIKIACRLRSETTMTWSGLCGAMSAPTMKRATCESSRLNPSDADAACAACACITYNSVSMFRTDPFLVKAEDAGVTGSAGTVAARYEYGPFGNTLRLSGEPVALDNPFRFSTKFQDDYAELLYYGFRFYNSSTGRWLNRDPISEAGGFNLYGFCRNDPIYYIDAYGRCWKLYFKASFWRA